MSAPKPYVTDPFRPLSSINNWYQFLYTTAFQLFHPCGMSKCVLRWIFNDCACALPETLLFMTQSHYNSCIFPYGTRWHKIHDIHACAFAVHTKQSAISFGFLFRRLLSRQCETFNINAEKRKFYSCTVVHFTLADLLENQKSQEAKFRDCHWCISIHFAPVYFDEK